MSSPCAHITSISNLCCAARLLACRRFLTVHIKTVRQHHLFNHRPRLASLHHPKPSAVFQLLRIVQASTFSGTPSTSTTGTISIRLRSLSYHRAKTGSYQTTLVRRLSYHPSKDKAVRSSAQRTNCKPSDRSTTRKPPSQKRSSVS